MEITNVAKTTSKVKRISRAGKSTTYDFTVRDTHRILANGFYTSNCAHPEIETFIDIKRDLKKVTGANVSIRFTDEFMRAVEANTTFTLRWPVEKSAEEAEVTRVVNARQVWEKFVDAAWSSAEPGALFWDTVTKQGIADLYAEDGFATISTNPCVTGDTVVQTNAGPKTVKELADNNAQFTVRAYDVKENKVVQKAATAFKTKDDAKILRLSTKSGKSIKLTPDHRVFTQRGWVEAGELLLSDQVLKDSTTLDAEWDEIQDISFVENEDVYDLTVDDVHNFFANDVLVHNCGEIPLSPYDSCRLMVVNLTSFVKDPFTPIAEFDYLAFHETTVRAQRLMDDLIDLELECVDRILEKIDRDPQPDHVKKIERDLWTKIRTAGSRGRRTGLGVTGLGDAIASLGVKYGSERSIQITEDIYRALAVGAHSSSLQLAAERGAFPAFDYEKERGHEYLRKVIDICQLNGIDAWKMWKETGRRNIALTTTAPVGSVSILTQTTSGIEPAFLLSYKRRRKVTPGDATSRVDFVDPMGDKWQEYTVYHHHFKKWMDVTGLSDPKDSPYWGGTANDIDWVNSVEIQAAAQRWIDHSISKTCNLPNSATRETVNDVYLRAWKSGCKGFTVYRDGCRTGVLVQAEPAKAETKKKPEGRTTPKREKSLPCDIHRVSVKDSTGQANTWLVLVGLEDGKPYEVFCGIPENIEIPKRYKTGSLIKNGKRDGVATYNLAVPVGDGENLVFKDVVNLFDNPTQGAFTRTISLALRHEVPLQYIVEQLQKDKNGDMFSFAKVIARVMKGYIKDGTTSSGKICPECGSDNLVYQEGCLSCVTCGHARCG